MKTSTRPSRKPVAIGVTPALFIAIAGVALIGWSAAARADNDHNGDKPDIVRPDVRYQGKTYGQWAAAWWQWALSIPEAQNPLTDTTGEFAGIGQAGPVWFLGGTFGNSVERTVNVPEGKSIFMPLHNWIFGAGVFDCDPTVPGVTCDVPALREKAAAATTGAEIVEAWIDGDKVRHIRSYRGISPEPFSITFPDGAVFGIPAGTYSPQVADGYWLMLTPPSKGRHTIRVHVVNSAAGIDMNLVVHLNVIKPERIVRPEAKFHGKTYGEWHAAFWQWSLALPLEGHPFLDTPEYDFSAGQSGSVWYWGAPDGPITRTVALPAGKALFLTIRDVETSSLEEPPFFGANEAAQRSNSVWFADHIINVFCFVDGVPVENLQDYRFQSPQFEFTAPTPWIFGDPANNIGGTGTAVGDGYFLLFPSLSKGKHTIHYGGTFHFEPGELIDEALDLPHDVTIQLTVGKDRHNDCKDDDDKHENK